MEFDYLGKMWIEAKQILPHLNWLCSPIYNERNWVTGKTDASPKFMRWTQIEDSNDDDEGYYSPLEDSDDDSPFENNSFPFGWLFPDRPRTTTWSYYNS